MFNVSDYLKHVSFSKVDYILPMFNMNEQDLSQILELDIDLVKYIIKSGNILGTKGSPLYEEVFEKFYEYMLLVNYVLKMANYNSLKFKDILEKSNNFYSTTISHPPWFQWSLKKYLLDNKYSGLKKCTKWIKEF